jgi:catechol 2,3-dioxygenase-like lactoylglutathione lyase family enzyme
MRVLETCLYAHNLETAEAFYRSLGFEFVSKMAGRHVFFRAGDAMLLIFNPTMSAMAGELPAHAGTPGSHVCFRVEQAEIPVWQARLEGMGVAVTPYEWSRGRGTSLYFHDPAGNLLEMAPAGIWGLA